jgi:hypothetical protein
MSTIIKKKLETLIGKNVSFILHEGNYGIYFPSIAPYNTAKIISVEIDCVVFESVGSKIVSLTYISLDKISSFCEEKN